MLSRLSKREADILLCLTDTAVAPSNKLPAVDQTGIVEAFNAFLRASQPIMKVGLRAIILLLEITPKLVGYRRRFRKLSVEQRTEYLNRAIKSFLAPVVNPVISVFQMLYYGEPSVHAVVGYDPAPQLERCRALRKEERRW